MSPKIGVALPVREMSMLRPNDAAAPLIELAQQVEELQFDSVWVGDSFVPPVQYGPRIMGTGIYLWHGQFLSRDRACQDQGQRLCDWLGMPGFPGWRRAARAVELALARGWQPLPLRGLQPRCRPAVRVTDAE